MEVFTLKEASRVTKIGVETLRRACQEGLIKAVKLPGGEYRIADVALEAALSRGTEFPSAPKTKSKRPQPEALRLAQEKRKKARAVTGK
jgi:excisionase family DNA binding protein